MNVLVITLDENQSGNEMIIKPAEFIEWAKKDLANFKNDERRAIGNAIGNIKKSIHCFIDNIIERTNLPYFKKWNTNLNTDQKIKIIQQLGIQSLSIVKLLTDIRNTFEHEYKLIPLNYAQAYLETAENWIEVNSSRSSFKRIAIIIKAKTINIKKDEFDNVINIEIGRDAHIEYYWKTKKELHEYKKGNNEVHKYSDIDWEEYLLYICKYISNFNSYQVIELKQKEMTNIYKKLFKFSANTHKLF